MQNGVIRYPIGIQTFSEIREGGYLYMDKTEFIYNMTHLDSPYVFLSRPRRFGKSLLVSTIKSYFEGRKELFKGLAIEKLEKEWQSFPVLHFSFAIAKHDTKERLESDLSFILAQYEKIYGRDQYIRFVFITGITKFSQLSIFSELNNLNNISMLEEYAGICGITESEMLELLQTFFATIPQTDNTNYEGYWQQMLYVIFSLLGANVDAEVRTQNGRVDMVARTANNLYLFEIKLNKSAEAAMNQIDLKQYSERFALSGLPVVNVAINFDSEKRNITDWIVR